MQTLVQILAAMRADAVEIAAAVTSLLCVWLTVRNDIWNWVWGFFGVILYGYVFWVEGLYANAALQILYYLPIQFIGYYVWLRFGPNKDDDLPVTLLSNRARLAWAVTTAALSVLLYFLFARWLPLLFPKIVPDPQPWVDGITTAVSIVAQYLQVPKRFENWILWFGVDIAYVYMFLHNKPPLWVSAVLYAIFVVLAAKGMQDWRKILRKQDAARTDAAAQQSAATASVTQHTESARPYA
jgi:nicotinamide mononucleotide transporter